MVSTGSYHSECGLPETTIYNGRFKWRTSHLGEYTYTRSVTAYYYLPEKYYSYLRPVKRSFWRVFDLQLASLSPAALLLLYLAQPSLGPTARRHVETLTTVLPLRSSYPPRASAAFLAVFPGGLSCKAS